MGKDLVATHARCAKTPGVPLDGNVGFIFRQPRHRSMVFGIAFSWYAKIASVLVLRVERRHHRCGGGALAHTPVDGKDFRVPCLVFGSTQDLGMTELVFRTSKGLGAFKRI